VIYYPTFHLHIARRGRGPSNSSTKAGGGSRLGRRLSFRVQPSARLIVPAGRKSPENPRLSSFMPRHRSKPLCRRRQPRSQELTRHSVQQRNVFRPCQVRYRVQSPHFEGQLLAGNRSAGAMISPLRLRPLLAGTCPSTTSPRGHPEPPSKDLESIWTTWRYRVRGSPSATAPLCRFPG